ncbi:MAG: DNA cytosine methyltransferase [Bradymonadales bacterium]|nr:MAG: DNA cytosine methyltransferase [Bradymonadales bacterium]
MKASGRKANCLELFCGAGGLGLGLEQAGFQIAYANDIDVDSCETYRANHPKTELDCRDIHDLDFKALARKFFPEGLDLLAGGPPCQGFSTVGSKRERDPRNNLFYEYLRAVYELQARFILFENVSGFQRLYEGRAFEALTGELRSLGYSFCWGVLDAFDFGLPQRRLRSIIVGWRKDSAAVELPTPSAKGKRLSLMDAIGDLPPLEAGEASSQYLCAPQNEYQMNLRKGSQELTEHSSSQYGKKMREILRRIPPGGSVKDLPLRLRPKSYFANTYARLLPDQPSPTITRNFSTPSSSRCVHPFQNRALTTREGARLQGFPDSYRFVGSKTSKNLQIGNAVPPVLGRKVGEQIAQALSQGKQRAPRLPLKTPGALEARGDSF